MPVIRPSREHAYWAGTKSAPWTESVIKGFNVVLISTAYANVNYPELVEWAPLIEDTRNALAGLPVKPGQRQDPEGPYAAVIPKWIAAMLNREPVCIHGDGQTSRDFCYVANVVQANLLAAKWLEDNPPSAVPACGHVFNIAAGGRTTLIQLFEALRDRLSASHP